MACRSIEFMRTLLLVEVLLVITCCVGGLETDVSMKELKFKLNEKFLFNTKACPIPTMEIDFAFPSSMERVLSRSHIVDLHGSSKWLMSVGRNVESDIDFPPRKVRTVEEIERQTAQKTGWLKKWRKAFKKNQYELIKKGEGMSSCIIWNTKERSICCENYLDKQQEHGELREFKRRFCMRLVKTFVDTLLKMGVILTADDEEKLEDELNKVLAKMAKTRARGKKSVSLTPIYEVGIEKVIPDDDRHPLTEEEKQRYAGEAELLQFLVAMKQIEYLLLIEKDSYVNDEQKAVYSTFMDAFQKCMKKKKAAVSYHTAEIRWTTCGPVTHGDFVAGYCADLAAVDPKAPELRRKPILKWEFGAYEHLHDLLDLDNIDTGVDGGDDGNNSQRTIVESGRYPELPRRSIRRKYADVDLLRVELVRADASCNGVDLANSCFAMCCDSGYKMSYFCKTAGLRCIG